MASGKVERVQNLRRSGAAGSHCDKRTRGAAKRKAVNDNN